MGWIIDLVFAALLVIIINHCSKQGLIKTLFGILSFGIAGLLTSVLYKPVTKFVLSIGIAQPWIDGVHKNVMQYMSMSLVQTFPKWCTEALNQSISGAADGVTGIIVSIICLVVLYFLIKFSLAFFKGTLNFIMKLPVLSSINRLGGGILGLGEAFLIFWIIGAVAVLFASAPFFLKLNMAIQNTYITKIFYNNNLLMNFIVGGK